MGSWPPQGFFPTNSVRPVFNAMDYGADPTNTRSSSTSIQNAINAATAGTGGIVYAGPGTYQIPTTLILKNGVTLRGSGKGSTILGGDGINTLILQIGDNSTTTQDWAVEDLRINAGTIADGTKILSGASRGNFANVDWFSSVTTKNGVVFDANGTPALAGLTTFWGCTIDGFKVGLRCTGQGAPYRPTNGVVFLGGFITGPGAGVAGSIGFDVVQGAQNSIVGTYVSSFEKGAHFGDQENKILGAHFDACTTGLDLDFGLARTEAIFTTAGATTALQTANNGSGAIFAAIDGVIRPIGRDNRTGLVAADGAAITLYQVPAAGLLFRITADIFATAVSAGTANYTISWTENAQAKTMVVSASVVNTLGTATDLINPDTGTNIQAQLTFAAFTGTVKVASIVEEFYAV